MIAVVDTGGANLSSIGHAFTRLGWRSEVTADPLRIRSASHVVLPGVGAAGHSMARVADAGLVGALCSLTQPVLGICLGMQLLFERSEEDDARMLGLLPGAVRAMTPTAGCAVPHMGWNLVRPVAACPLFEGLEHGAHFYFAHSYVAPSGAWVVAETEHGDALPASVRLANYHGVQFHPERSGPAGARLLSNFLAP